MRLDYWLAIWTGLAAILVLDTWLIRNARLKRRDSRTTPDHWLGFIAVVVLSGIASLIGIGLYEWASDPAPQYWTWWQMTPQTFPEKP